MRLACLDDDVAWMPEGLATVVGAKGVRLSGGQIQRTAAARAFVRRPELLVVDDISSALDVDTEARMWAQLLDTGATSTVLVVSHRPAVLERADQVVELAGRPPGRLTNVALLPLFDQLDDHEVRRRTSGSRRLRRPARARRRGRRRTAACRSRPRR